MASGQPADASTTVRHPLDPLSRRRDPRRPPRSCAASTGVGRRLALRVDRAARAGEGRARACGRRPVERAARRRLLEPRRRPGLQGASSRSPTTASRRWEHRPGVQPNFTVDEWHECDEALRRDPRRRRGARPARHHRHGPRAHRHLGLRRARSSPSSYARPPRRLVRRLAPRQPRAPTRTPTRSAACTRRRPQHASSCSRSRTPASSSGRRRDGRVRAAARAGPAAARRPQAARDHPARGRLVHPRRQRAALAELVDAARASTTARAWSCTRVGYEDGGRVRPIAHRLSFAEMVVPYRDPTPDHYRAHGVRHRRVGPRLHDDLARARLRLPRRDPLPRRRAARLAAASRTTIRNAICIHEEDNAVLWKHVDQRRGRRGAAHAPARGLLPRHRRQLRVPRLLALLPGRQHRVRGARHRDHGHHAVPEGEQPPYGTLVDERTYAPFHQHFIVARLDMDVDGDGQHRRT